MRLQEVRLRIIKGIKIENISRWINLIFSSKRNKGKRKKKKKKEKNSAK
jgi:hypothetical protein